MDWIWAAALCRMECVKWFYSWTVLHRCSCLLKLLAFTVWMQKKTELFSFMQFLTDVHQDQCQDQCRFTKDRREENTFWIQVWCQKSMGWILGFILRSSSSSKRKVGGSGWWVMHENENKSCSYEKNSLSFPPRCEQAYLTILWGVWLRHQVLPAGLNKE